ncbi:MAG: VTT domain-containing protein [Candidatus Deferrimicrobiaceae bacterium]
MDLLNRKKIKIIKFTVFLAFAGTVGYLLFFTPLGERFLTPEGRKEMVGGIDLLVRSAGPFGPALFVLLYAFGVLGLPATPFNAAGAFIFGKVTGTICNILGATLGAALSFVLGRYFLRDFAKGLLLGKLGELDRKAEKHGFSLVFYLRIVWFPFIFLNYGAGATRIRFGDYFWATFFGIMPAIVIASYFFGSLKEIIASYEGPADLFQFNVLFPVGLLFFSFFLPPIVRRIRGERSPESDPATGPE